MNDKREIRCALNMKDLRVILSSLKKELEEKKRCLKYYQRELSIRKNKDNKIMKLTVARLKKEIDYIDILYKALKQIKKITGVEK